MLRSKSVPAFARLVIDSRTDGFKEYYQDYNLLYMPIPEEEKKRYWEFVSNDIDFSFVKIDFEVDGDVNELFSRYYNWKNVSNFIMYYELQEKTIKRTV